MKRILLLCFIALLSLVNVVTVYGQSPSDDTESTSRIIDSVGTQLDELVMEECL